MNFSQFKSSLKASAEAAATAARSFKSFDEMAANDDYVNSTDNLNVPDYRRKATERKPGRGKTKGDFADNEQKSAQTHHNYGENANRWSRDTSTNEQQNPVPHRCDSLPVNAPTTRSKHMSLRQDSMPLLSAATSTLLAKRASHADTDNNYIDVERGNFEDHSSVSNIGSSDEDSDDDDDPILSLMRNGKNPNSKRPLGPGKRLSAPTETFTSITEQKSKPHRFLSDLEDRLSRPSAVEMNTDVHEDSEASSSSVSPSKPVVTSSFSWLTAIMGDTNQKIKATSKVVSRDAPLARRKQQVASSDTEEETFDIVNSTTMLAQDELRALQLLKETSLSSTNPCTLFCSLLKEHPREAVVCFTLVFGIIAYFLSRRYTLEDNV